MVFRWVTLGLALCNPSGMRYLAKESNRSVESVLLDGLALLFGTLANTDIAPDERNNYTDDQLWAVAGIVTRFRGNAALQILQ
jgi:hypothetical protein